MRAGGSSMDTQHCANSTVMWFLDLLLNCNYFWSLWNIRIVRKNTHYHSEVRGRTETSLIFHLQFTLNLYLRENAYSEINKVPAEKGLIQNKFSSMILSVSVTSTTGFLWHNFLRLGLSTEEVRSLHWILIWHCEHLLNLFINSQSDGKY